jgi:hypothetical protein
VARPRLIAGETCAITFTDEELWCWPASPDGADSGERMLDGQFQSLAVNLNGEGCGVTRQGDIRCWGAADYQPPAGARGPFQAISIGGPQACALSADGRAICWKAPPLKQERRLKRAAYFRSGPLRNAELSLNGHMPRAQARGKD